MIIKKYSWFLFFLLPMVTSGQMRLHTAAEIKQGLQQLAVTGRVLYIAAHPDDENTRLLTWLAKSRKLRTGYLSLTRGDGGQNLIGNEQSDELGIIRTQELLAARRIDGAEQYFSRAIDFGFSKTAEETLTIWNKEKVLGDIVRTIRSFKPDVIITRFPPDKRAGHGNHIASSMLAIEAFSAAADPRRFPDLGKPWQTSRILWNTYNFGGNNTTSPDQLKINVGGYNPLLGKSYGELAAYSRSQHKSQGFGTAPQRGPEYEFFALLDGKPAKADLLEDIDISWNRIPGGDNIARLLETIDRTFDMLHPVRSVSGLLKLRRLIGQINDAELRDYKLKEIDQLILSCAGVWFEINAVRPEFSVSDSVPVRIEAVSLLGDSLALPVTFSESLSGMPATALSGKVLSVERKIGPQNLTQPYWLTYERSAGSYNIGNEEMSRPENEPPTGIFTIMIGGERLSVRRPVQYKYTDPVKGEVYKPLVITPPVIISAPQKMVFSANASFQPLVFKVTANENDVKGHLQWQLSNSPVGWSAAKPFRLEHIGDTALINIPLADIITGKNSGAGEIKVRAVTGEKSYSFDKKTISYSHLPEITYFPETRIKYVNAEIKTAGKRIAYIAGAGDRIPASLRLIGYTVDEFTPGQVGAQDLSLYDAVIAGVRLYNVDGSVSKLRSQLMEYVRNGGIYLVQYNVNSPLSSDLIGPYSFKIGNSRVTDENATVTILDSKAPVLNYPNRITPADFEDWVQERGLYFVSDFDKNYRPVLEMHDPGEPQNNGSLIVSNFGKGRFVYTSLSFFRQLPAGVPGAYRLFVNLIAKKK